VKKLQLNTAEYRYHGFFLPSPRAENLAFWFRKGMVESFSLAVKAMKQTKVPLWKAEKHHFLESYRKSKLYLCHVKCKFFMDN